MPYRRSRHYANLSIPLSDDKVLSASFKDMSAGQNNRQHPSLIAKNEASVFRNVDIALPGQRSSRPGLTLVEDLGANAITGMFSYDPQGATANLLVTEGTNLKRWEGTGSFSSAIKSDFTTNLPTSIVQAFKTGVGDVVLISNGTDNVFEMTQSYGMTDLGNTNTSPPKTVVLANFRNRVWGLKTDLAYFSSASPSDYSTAFDRTTNNFRIPVGEERAIVPLRDQGLFFLGKNAVWSLNPSVVPAATDKPEKISDIGCAAGNTACQVGDDILYLGFNGVWGIKRTELDKLQYGEALPLSYRLKSEFELINWAYITKACAIYFDNKYFLALPTGSSTYNNQVWVYYPATNGWSVITGWNVASWAKFKISGQERLYAGEASADGKVYRAWSGSTDNSTAITFQEEGRSDDLEHPERKKVGGFLKVVAKPTGNYNISVYGSFDNGSYNLLGTVNVSTGLITFPTTFPVTFRPDNEALKTFPLDSYGPWYQFKYKLYNADTRTNADDITIYEVSIITYPEEIIYEESTE